MSHHANSTLEINVINLRTADLLTLLRCVAVALLWGAPNTLGPKTVPEVLLDDRNTTLNPQAVVIAGGYLYEVIEEIKSCQSEVKASKLDRR